MTARAVKTILGLVIAVTLIAVPSSANQTAHFHPKTGGAADSASMSASQLQALVAPMALYPDQLSPKYSPQSFRIG